MEIWKHSKCGDCKFKTDPPGGQNTTDLSAPKIFICRYNPPTILYAMAAPRVQGGAPNPVPLGSMYPLIDGNHLACSKFERERKMPDSLNFGGQNPNLDNDKTKPL